MNGDVKLGLALGMLVIGFAAAFCFPRQPADHAPTLSTAQDASESQHKLIPIRAHEQSAARTELAPAEEDLVLPAVAIAHDDSKPATAPLIPVPTASQLEVDAPRRQMPRQPLESRSSVRESTPGGAEQRQYVVQPGDTLSSIALEMLGSSTRFAEIFQANRHQLSSPNDLKLNMVLVIPSRERREVEPTLAETPIAESTTPDNTDAPPYPQLSEDANGTLH